MGRIEQLSDIYERHISLPWVRGLAGAERTIFVVYDKTDERKLRAKKQLFELATKRADHGWHEIDLTDVFAAWIASDEYREAYFEAPEHLRVKLGTEFINHAADRLRAALTGNDVDDDTVVAVLGAAALYGFARLSEVLKKVEGDIRGRLLLFFPGDYDQNSYRLLDARDGWNYLAVPITLHGGMHE